MDFLIPPWQHQIRTLEHGRLLDQIGLFWDPGTGKTGMTINWLRAKFNDQKHICRTLIFCPPIVIKNWKDEWHKHSKIEKSQVILLTGSGAERKKKFIAFGWDRDGKRQGGVVVTNYEALLMSDLFWLFKDWEPEAIIADESHKIKDPKAKRTRLAIELGNAEWKTDPRTKTKVLLRPEPRYKAILTGTPVLNSPMDLFSQFLFLDGGKTFGRNFFIFRATYFRDLNAGMPKAKYFPNWVPIEARIAEMSAKIATTATLAKKADCLDLPPFVTKTIKVGMDPRQAKAYQEMKNEFITWMETEGRDPSPVTANLAITKALRLMQITSGFARTVDGEDFSFAFAPKIKALGDLLEDLAPHHKVVVWAVWKENYEQIRSVCERLKLQFVEVTGDTPAGKRFENVDRFNTDPNVRVFLGHPGSGGIGINLVSSDISIFYSRTFSLEHSLQAEARNYRGGSERHASVTRIDLVCESTIDELVQEKLLGKIEIGKAVLKDLVADLKKELSP